MEHILYEDTHILVLHKLAGIPVQTKLLGEKDLVSILKNDRIQKKETPYIAVVNRLDQPVEGLILFAKTKEAAANLSMQLNKNQIEKYYRAIVCQPKSKRLKAGESCTLTDYLIKDGRTNISRVVKAGEKDAKKAVLQYTVRKTNDDFAELGKTDPLFAKLDEACKRNRGMWSAEAERILFDHFGVKPEEV